MVTIRMERRLIFLLLAVLLATAYFCASATAESEFSVQRIGQMVSNRENVLSVEAPEDGVFSAAIRDDWYTYRIFTATVVKGTNRILWDGCGYNSEKLDTQYYTFDFALQGNSGTEYRFSFRSSVVNNAQYLQFVLPSGDEAYTAASKDWFIEVRAVRDGTVRIDFTPEGAEDPAFFAEKKIHGGRVEHYTFEKLFAKGKAAPGKYTVTVYEETVPENASSFPLQILEGDPQREPVGVTGNIMIPEDADDSTIWEAMMKPGVVIDAEFNKSFPVYEEPDKSAKTLGTLHGMTQCLSVFELKDGWARVGAWNHESADYIEGWIPADRLKTEKPNGEYGLLVNKKEQTITVFHNGERLETLLVSTGHMDPGKFIRETAAGMFLTGLHRVDFSMQGSKYDYVIQYDGGNLLHQIPYSSAGRKDFKWGKAYLGSKASHACIRIQDTPGPQRGINAYWIWTHIPYRTKLIILDDPEERGKAAAILNGTVPIETDSGLKIMQNAPEKNENTVVLTFGGNVTAGSAEGTFYGRNSVCLLIEQKGADYLFGALQGIFAEDDWTSINLECTLKADGSGFDRYRKIWFRGLPEYAAILPAGSIEMACLGNEHVYDYRESGFQSTVSAVSEKAEWIGYGHTAETVIKGHRFGFAACTEEEYLADTGIIEKQVSSLRANGCEYVIYQCHWGEDGSENHGKLQEAMARSCARAGADLLIGHHPGSMQGIDEIGGMPVVWSLGNLVPPASARAKICDSLLVQAVFTFGGDEKTPALYLIPVTSEQFETYEFSGRGSFNTARPAPAEGTDRERVLQSIQKDTAFRITDDQ